MSPHIKADSYVLYGSVYVVVTMVQSIEGSWVLGRTIVLSDVI